VARDPSFLEQPQPTWLFGHDATKYAEDNYNAVVKSVREGTSFVSTNVPEGHVHEDWTIEEMMAREGVKAEPEFYKVKR
jgi:hypothetical protein